MIISTFGQGAFMFVREILGCTCAGELVVFVDKAVENENKGFIEPYPID